MRFLPLVVLSSLLIACGGGAGGPSTPVSPSPAPQAAPRAAIVIEDFSAAAAAAPGGLMTYRASLTLRETAGVGAAISGVTLTLTQTSGVTVSQDFAPTDAFGGARIAAHGTLPSANVSATGPPVMARELAVRVTFVDDNGNAGSAQGSAPVAFAGS